MVTTYKILIRLDVCMQDQAYTTTKGCLPTNLDFLGLNFLKLELKVN